MALVALGVLVWVAVAFVLCEMNRRRNPNEHGVENAIACLWPIFAPYFLVWWILDLLKRDDNQ